MANKTYKRTVMVEGLKLINLIAKNLFDLPWASRHSLDIFFEVGAVFFEQVYLDENVLDKAARSKTNIERFANILGSASWLSVQANVNWLVICPRSLVTAMNIYCKWDIPEELSERIANEIEGKDYIIDAKNLVSDYHFNLVVDEVTNGIIETACLYFASIINAQTAENEDVNFSGWSWAILICTLVNFFLRTSIRAMVVYCLSPFRQKT